MGNNLFILWVEAVPNPLMSGDSDFQVSGIPTVVVEDDDVVVVPDDDDEEE